MNDLRMKRVESLIRDHISSLIMLGELKDPRINTLLSITHVKISNDLTLAKVMISSLEGEAKLAKSVKALNHAAGFIQNKIGRQLRMRQTPHLVFAEDTSVRDSIALNKKIDSLMHHDNGDE